MKTMKRNHRKRLLIICLLLSVTWVACEKDEDDVTAETEFPDDRPDGPTPNLPSEYYNYANQVFPAHFNANRVQGFDNTPANNPTTDAGATLGRVLFFDRALSQNFRVSCASCHRAQDGFSDDRVLSLGFEGGLTRRHSMPAINLAFYDNGRFFWDERATSLEDQVLKPIQDEVEMGMTLPDLVDRLQGIDYYPALFEDAFGTTEITDDLIARALAQYIRSIVSYQSPFDEGIAQVNDIRDNFPNFTAEENMGKGIFLTSCANCHMEPSQPGNPNFAIFHLQDPSNNGLDAVSTDDLGLAETTGNPQDEGKFKSATMRNIELTAPYMHDGRFSTLEEVVDFYSTGVQNHPNLAPQLRVPGPGGGQPRRFNFTQEQKDALVAFMLTLTDDEIANDPKFSNPFRRD